MKILRYESSKQEARWKCTTIQAKQLRITADAYLNTAGSQFPALAVPRNITVQADVLGMRELLVTIWKQQKEILPEKSLVLLYFSFTLLYQRQLNIYTPFSHEMSQKAERACMAHG